MFAISKLNSLFSQYELKLNLYHLIFTIKKQKNKASPEASLVSSNRTKSFFKQKVSAQDSSNLLSTALINELEGSHQYLGLNTLYENHLGRPALTITNCIEFRSPQDGFEAGIGLYVHQDLELVLQTMTL